MKVLLGLLVLFGAILVVSAQTPSSPTWPRQFSSSVFVRRNVEPHEQYFRWFWDEKLQMDRVDGRFEWEGEQYFGQLIFDHPQKLEYNVFYQNEEVVCFTRKINQTMPHPNLSGLKYIGQAVVAYEKAYHWLADDHEKGITWQLYDNQQTREILRVDRYDHRQQVAEAWIFWEFDEGAQDRNLFAIPALIADTCNPASQAE